MTKTTSYFAIVVLLLVQLSCRLVDVSATPAQGEIPATKTPKPKLEKPTASFDVEQSNQKVDQFFARFVGAHTPGGVVIVLRDGKTLYQAAYGLSNLKRGTPLSLESVMHIGSVGKQMTALAIMMLAEEGKLKYDDPVGKYIPELKHYGDDLTIRHLLHHTSGLDDYNTALEDRLYARAAYPTNADLVAVLSQMKGPTRRPGAAFDYSNPGYELLAVVIERVSKQTFPKFMQTRIFDPLKMTHTFSLPNATRRADPLVAMSYTGSAAAPEAYPSDDFDGLYGSGSIYTTIGDMALYDEALYAGTLISTEALQDAFQPGKLNNGKLEPYGFGWELETYKGQSYVAHSGGWLGFISDYVRFPEQHFSVIVLLNRDYGYPDEPRIGLKVASFYLDP